MANSKYSNFDYDLSQKMLTLLKGNNGFIDVIEFIHHYKDAFPFLGHSITYYDVIVGIERHKLYQILPC